MGVALIAGALLAKRKRYAAHGICQTTLLLLNLGMIGLVMWPSFQQQVRPALPEGLHRWYFAAATIHALLGGTAECGTHALVYCRPHRCWDLLRLVYSSVPLVLGWGDLSHIKPMVRRPNSDVKSADISLFGNISQVAEF